jgi:hypothetical protein
MDKINQMYIGQRLGPTDSDNIFDLQYWCRDYNRRNKFPADNLKRFAIGFYQIHQGIGWKDNGINKYESYAASVLHFIMLCEQMDLDFINYINDSINLYQIDQWPRYYSFDGLLFNLSAVQQQLFYANSSNKTKRKSRYNKDKLTRCLTECIVKLNGLIPEEHRNICYYTASKIMTEELK